MGENGAPMAVIDYAISQLNNPDLDVRNGAITLLAIANRKDSQKIAAKLLGLKKTVITQINEKSGNWASPKKGERSVSKKH